MEVEICSDSADNSSCASDEGALGRYSTRTRRPSLNNSSEDQSTPPKRRKSVVKSQEQTIEEIYKQLAAVKAKSTSLETIYEQPKNFKDPSRNLMAGVKTRRSCVLAEFYNPSKFKIKARKEKAKKLKRLGVKVPTGDLISEAELKAALAVISEDEDEMGINKTCLMVNTSIILASPKRDVYLPSPEVPLVSGSSYIVPDQSFIEDNLDACKDMCPEELYKINLPFLDDPSEKVDRVRSSGRKSRRSGGLRDFHSSTLSFRKEAAALAAKEPSNNANISLEFEPGCLSTSFKERISAMVEGEEQDESPGADEEEATSQSSYSSSCRSSKDLGLPSSPKDYSSKDASSPSKSPRKYSLSSSPTQALTNKSRSSTVNEQTIPRGSSSPNCSPKILSSDLPSRSKSPGTKASCVSCKNSLKRPTRSPSRPSCCSKVLRRVSSPPPPCTVCSDCSVAGTTLNKIRRDTDERGLNYHTRIESTSNSNVFAATSSMGLRCDGKQSKVQRGKRQLSGTGSSDVAFSSVTAKRTTGNVGSQRLSSTTNKKSTSKRRVSGVLKTLYCSYLEHSSPEEEKNNSTNTDSDIANNTKTNVLESSCVEHDIKKTQQEQGNEEHINESRNDFMRAISKSVEVNVDTSAGNVSVEENSIFKKNLRKRKFDAEMSIGDHSDIRPLTSQMSHLEMTKSGQQTTTVTPSRSVGHMRKGRRKTLDPAGFPLNTLIQTFNTSPKFTSKPTTYSPTCQMSQLTLASPVNQRNRSKNNHRRRSTRLQVHTLMPQEECAEECSEIKLALPDDETIPLVLNESVIHGIVDAPRNCNEREEKSNKNSVCDKKEDLAISFKMHDDDDEDDDEETEISFKMHDSSRESETELMTEGQCPVDSSIPVVSLASPVKSSASLPTVRKKMTRRSALITKDSFTTIVDKPTKGGKRRTTVIKTKERCTSKPHRHSQAIAKLSPRSAKVPNLSSKHPPAASSKPRRFSSLKTGLITESASPPATRAGVVRKAAGQNTTKTRYGPGACHANKSVRVKKATDANEIEEFPALKANQRNSPSAKTLAGKASSTKTNNADKSVKSVASVSSDITPSTVLTSIMGTDSNNLLKESTLAIANGSKLEQLDNNNEKDIKMNEIVTSTDTSGSTNQVDRIESLVTPTIIVSVNSDLDNPPCETSSGKEIIDKEEPGSMVSSSTAPHFLTNESVATASLSPPANPAVLVPAALPSPAETKKAFYLINKCKPGFSLSSRPSLGLNCNDGSTNDLGSGFGLDKKDVKVQRRKSSGAAIGGGGRTCFAVHPALASCTTDVFAGRKMLFIPDKKDDGLEKTSSSAQAAFLCAVSKKLSNATLEPKQVAVDKGACRKGSNTKVRKRPATEGTNGVSPKGGKERKGNVNRSQKDGKGTGLKKSRAVLGKTGKGLSPKEEKSQAVKKDVKPASPGTSAVASGSGGSSSESPKLSRSPFGGKGKTKIMLNDLADHEAIFDAPSPTIERKDYIRTCLGGSTVSSLSPVPLLLKPGNAFSPPTLKPAQHIFPPSTHKPFNLPRSSTTPFGSTVSTTLVASKLSTAASLPPIPKLPVASVLAPKNAVIFEPTFSKITKADSAGLPACVPNSVGLTTVTKLSGSSGAGVSFHSMNGYCPTAPTLQTQSAKPLTSFTGSAPGTTSNIGSLSNLSKPTSYVSVTSKNTNQLHSGSNQAVQDPSNVGFKDTEHRPVNSCVASAPVVDLTPASTTLLATSTIQRTPTQQQPSTTPAFFPAPSSLLQLSTPAPGVLNLNADSPLLSGMFNNAVGVRVGKVFTNPKSITVQKDSEPKKLLPTFTVFPH